jgi:type III pantothenate kinase
MTPRVVIDIGNSRIKWGLCSDDRIVQSVSLPPDDSTFWEKQVEGWQVLKGSPWAIATVHPDRLSRIVKWLQHRGDTIHVLRDWRDLGLEVLVDNPERVGIDRLLNAVAARSKGTGPAIMIDAGTAITVDYLDEKGRFCGGSILPGMRLMGQALHSHTAQLPLVEGPKSLPPVPGRSTVAAIEAGIYWGAVGAVRVIVEQLESQSANPPRVFLTGGDAATLACGLGEDFVHWPEMTLEGIRIAAAFASRRDA